MTREDSPAQLAAWAWARAVQASDGVAVWPLCSPTLRLALTQMWIVHNAAVLDEPQAREGRDAFARMLADAIEPDGPLWEACVHVSTRTLRQTFGDFADEELAPGERPRLLGPDLELVRLFNLRDVPGGVFRPGATAVTMSVLCTLGDEGWGVAGVGDHLLLPGWPPTQQRVDLGGD